MDYEVLSSYDNGRTKVVEVLPRRHNAEKSWSPEEIVTFQWEFDERYTQYQSGKWRPKTGADFKEEIEAALNEEADPKVLPDNL